MGGWNDKELGRQYEKKSAEHAEEMAKRLAAELKASRLEEAVRTARALADHVVHGERDLASPEDIHKVLSDVLRLVGAKL